MIFVPKGVVLISMNFDVWNLDLAHLKIQEMTFLPLSFEIPFTLSVHLASNKLAFCFLFIFTFCLTFKKSSLFSKS
jgi:hypothetical protein